MQLITYVPYYLCILVLTYLLLNYDITYVPFYLCSLLLKYSIIHVHNYLCSLLPKYLITCYLSTLLLMCIITHVITCHMPCDTLP